MIKKSLFTLCLVACCLPVISGNASLAPTADGKVPTTIAPMLESIMPAVVNVTVIGETHEQPAQPSNSRKEQPPSASPSPSSGNSQPYYRKFEETGSGVITDAEKGYIVTNAHVVVDAKIITITLKDGRRFKAKLIGFDKPSDIAVLQIRPDHLVSIPLANSDELHVGDFVAAIGNPFGLRETVTTGIVSGLNRNDLGIEGYENFIQTDASINPGNSGGALVNLKGQVVGINTALIGPISGNVGIGLSIPSNMVKQVMEQLIKDGKVQRGVLGVMVQDLTPALADAFNLSGKQGALITNITPGSPADKAGLKPQDIIESVNKVDIISSPQLRNMLGLMPIGTKAVIQLHRQDKPLTLTATIISPKDLKMTTQPELTSFMDGVRLTSYDQLIPEFGPVKGVGVLDVDEASDAWISGLRAGDVILEANGKPAVDLDHLMDIVKTAAPRLLLKVGRDQGIIFVVINKYS